MRKSDLRSGMILELRNGQLGILIQTRLGLLIQFDNSWDSLEDYNLDLTAKIDRDCDVFKVKQINSETFIIRKNLNRAKTIWNREEQPIELTIDEIADKFGVDSSRIKIKK